MNSVVFTFIRANPPTTGHSLVITKVVEVSKNLGADHIVYLSQTQKAPENPLDWVFKRNVLEEAFPSVNFSKDTDIRTPFDALDHFAGQYENVTLIAGSDRVEEFRSRMEKYADAYGFNFDVVSAGTRIAESTGVEGVSATRMRQHAASGNMPAFFDGLPTTLNNSTKELVYSNTRAGIKNPE